MNEFKIEFDYVIFMFQTMEVSIQYLQSPMVFSALSMFNINLESLVDILAATSSNLTMMFQFMPKIDEGSFHLKE